MKGSRSQDNRQSKQMMSHRAKPEIRDDLDSREGLEQDTKGDDVTHNKKETHSKHEQKRKDRK